MRVDPDKVKLAIASFLLKHGAGVFFTGIIGYLMGGLIGAAFGVVLSITWFEILARYL